MTDTTVQNTDSPPPAAHSPAAAADAAPTSLNPFRAAEPTPPPATASSTTTPPAPTQAQGAPADPRIVSLRAMFPDYDDLILQSVLASVNGDEARAIDALLGMSDPEYKGEPTAPEVPALSQTELDEQLARRLMLEEQEQHQAAWQAQQDARRPQWSGRPASGQGQGQVQGQQQGQGGDTMTEIQQQLGKIAETGKKTFGNIFSKVKAKIQEMDQPKTGQPSGTQPTWGGGSSTGYDPALYEQRLYQGQTQPQPQLPYATRPQQSQQPAYYDPNAQTSYPIRAPQSPSPPITLGQHAPSGVQGYDVALEPARSTSPPSTTTPRPPSTGSGLGSQSQSSSQSAAAPIDGGKLGLLPKRPVSLLRPQSPPVVQAQHSQQSVDDDEDGLEYAENPFEEPKPKTTANLK